MEQIWEPFWKGTWGLLDIVFDELIFREHFFWSNLTAMSIGIIILGASGLVVEKIA
jgi:hypothetical protein